MTGHIAHHAAKSLIFPIVAPGSQPKRAPKPYDPAQPDLGTRDVTMSTGAGATVKLVELPVSRS